jgi:lipoate-protein ligase A
MPVELRGLADLTLGLRKFAGSAQRRLRRTFMVHSSILYNFPLQQISKYTAPPRRQPAYRAGRPHADFVTNLAVSRGELVAALQAAWLAPELPISRADVPEGRVRELVAEKFGQPQWIERF